MSLVVVCRQLYVNEREKRLRSVHVDALKQLCRQVNDMCLSHGGHVVNCDIGAAVLSHQLAMSVGRQFMGTVISGIC